MIGALISAGLSLFGGGGGGGKQQRQAEPWNANLSHYMPSVGYQAPSTDGQKFATPNGYNAPQAQPAAPAAPPNPYLPQGPVNALPDTSTWQGYYEHMRSTPAQALGMRLGHWAKTGRW